jgi:hypothetical protein
METLLLAFFLIYPLFLARTGSLRPGAALSTAQPGFEATHIPRREAPGDMRQRPVGEAARINRAA